MILIIMIFVINTHRHHCINCKFFYGYILPQNIFSETLSQTVNTNNPWYISRMCIYFKVVKKKSHK